MGIVKNYIIDPAAEKAKEEINTWITAALEIARDFVLDVSYSIGLIGGGVLVLLRGLGIKSAKKYFVILETSYVLIHALLGEAQW